MAALTEPQYRMLAGAPTNWEPVRRDNRHPRTRAALLRLGLVALQQVPTRTGGLPFAVRWEWRITMAGKRALAAQPKSIVTGTAGRSRQDVQSKDAPTVSAAQAIR